MPGRSGDKLRGLDPEEDENQNSGRAAAESEKIMKKETAIEKAFRKANLIGEDVDLWGVIYSYKVLRELPEEEIDEIYYDLAERLGFHF